MRLIDADALVEKFDYEGWIESAIAVEGEPTIDAVPVVRCRECRYNPRDGAFIGCPFEHRVHCLPDMYCGFGQRREDGLYQSLKRGLEEAIAYERGKVECRTDRREDGDADPVRRGKWEIGATGILERCSVCRYGFYTSALFSVGGMKEPPYCPNCGAKMDG